MSWQRSACPLYTPTGYRFQGIFSAMDHAHHSHAADDGETVVRDPVCGMRVDPELTPHRHAFGHQDFFFCCDGCRAKFAADPEKYVDGAAARPAGTAPEGTIYTCPMHPEVRQIGPGHCPICGMALEPEAGGVADADDGERGAMVRRLWISALLTAPVLALD